MEQALKLQRDIPTKVAPRQCTRDDPFMDVSTAAMITGIPERTIRLRCKTGQYRTAVTSGVGGQGGLTYHVFLSNFEDEHKLRYYAMMDDGIKSADLAAYHVRYGDAGIAELWTRMSAVYAFDNAATVEDKQAVAKKIGCDIRTLYRWSRGYQLHSIAGLMNKMEQANKGKPKTICLFAQDFIKHQLYNSSKRTNAAIFAKLKELKATTGDRACSRCPHCEGTIQRREYALSGQLAHCEVCDRPKNGLVIPSDKSTINRYTSTIPADEIAYAQRGNRYWEANFMHKIQRIKPDKANECWFGDHHMFDLFVIDDNGAIVRPWMTAWSDAASGCFVGYGINTNPNSQTVAETFARAVVQTSSEFSGLPSTIYIDNGKDYRSKKFEGEHEIEISLGKINEAISKQGLLPSLNVAVIHAQPYKAWSKIIERLFGTLEDRYIRELPGWCGGRPSERPEDLSRSKLERMAANGELLTIRQFEQLLRSKIIPMYHAERFDNEQSPIEIYRSMEKARYDMPSYDILSLMRNETETRKINYMGIRLKKQWYWHDSLRHMVGQEVTIKYDKYDLNYITVVQGNRFICVATIPDKLRLVGEDPSRIAAHIAGQKRSRQEIRANIVAAQRSVDIGLRNVIYEPIDLNSVTGGITTTEYRRAANEMEAAKSSRRAAKKQDAEATDAVTAMLLQEGRKALGLD